VSKSKTTSWLQLSLDIWRASLEAQQVIGLRLAKAHIRRRYGCG